MSSQFKLDINFGPFRLIDFPLNVQFVRCDDDFFNKESTDIHKYSSTDSFLFSLPVNDGEQLPHQDSSNRIVYTTYSATRYWITTKGNYDDWLKGLTANTRQGIRRKRKKMVEANGGELDVRRYDTPDVMAEFFDHARAISMTTFHEKKLGLGLPGTQDFCEEITGLAGKGLCYGSLLFLDGEPISYIYCDMRGRRCEPIYRGFNPEHRRLSPGFVHHVLLIEESFHRSDCDYFDFGLTAFQYKEQLSTDRADCENVLVLSKTIRHRAAILLHRTMTQTTDWVNRQIEIIGIKARLRQWLRGTAS